jgi:hypothetical protein
LGLVTQAGGEEEEEKQKKSQNWDEYGRYCGREWALGLVTQAAGGEAENEPALG